MKYKIEKLKLHTRNEFGSFTASNILTFIEDTLGYLKDSNAAVHSVDSDIFYAVIYLSARSKTCSNICFSKWCQLVLYNLKSVLVLTNFMYDNASMARCDKGS